MSDRSASGGQEQANGRPAGTPRRQRRRKVPTVLQMEAVECGAACLAMILAYHGHWAPLEELRIACGVSRDGSKASNIVRAARRYGLEANGKKIEPQDFGRLHLPAIIFWNFNHFVVVEGIGRGVVYLNDPGKGQRSVTFKEFDESFTGVAIEFKPTESFKKTAPPPGPMALIGERFKGSWDGVFAISLLSLFLFVPGILIPAFSKIFVDDVLGKHLTSWLLPLLMGMGATALLRAGISWLRGRLMMTLHLKLGIFVASRLVWHLLRLPMTFFSQRRTGDVVGRIGACQSVAGSLVDEVGGSLVNFAGVIFFPAIMFLYDSDLTLIGIAVTFLNFLVFRWATATRINLSRSLINDSAKLSATAINGIYLIETIKATGGDQDFFTEYTGNQAAVMNGTQQLAEISMWLGMVPTMLQAVSNLAVLGIGSVKAMNGSLSLGELVAFQSLLASFTAPVNAVMTSVSRLQDVRNTLERVNDVERSALDPRFAAAATDGAAAPRLDGHVTFSGVSFGYSPIEPPLIVDFNLSIPPGNWVALVGGSGSGKSTVARMAAGLAQSWSGDILFDGRPAAAWPRDVLSRSVGTVTQEVFLFQGTVRDNITLWDATVPESSVVAAAKDACLHDVIAARPGGYDSSVAEAGRNFSGGQGQRMEIARALVGNPSVLILDEATSALDPLTEMEIIRNLRRRGCTVIVVAHRLSTIRDCDEILVMRNGAVVQRGTHEEMSAIPGPYADLIHAE
jgi:NHLM bacteriocin system ABC transporter peptidase/ATP-binding protein